MSSPFGGLFLCPTAHGKLFIICKCRFNYFLDHALWLGNSQIPPDSFLGLVDDLTLIHNILWITLFLSTAYLTSPVITAFLAID